METSPGQRLRQWRDFKKLTLAQVSEATGVKTTTLSTTEQPGANNPSYDTITKVLAAYPDLNPDWLLLGTGPMLRDGRALTPVDQLPPAIPSELKPKPAGFPATPGTATPQEVDFVGRLINRLETELAQAQAREEYLQNLVTELLGKSPGSLLAAGLPYPSPVMLTPIGPRFDTELVEAKVVAMWKQAA